MTKIVMVSKAKLIDLLGDSAFTFAMFMAEPSIQNAAVKILFENVDSLDLNSSMVKNILMPLLLSKNAISQEAADRINVYVLESVGV